LFGHSFVRIFTSHLKLIVMKEKMLLSEFIKGLGISNHPNVVHLLPLLKENLEKNGDVTIELGMMKKLMELK
jgi:hypothetical protein